MVPKEKFEHFKKYMEFIHYYLIYGSYHPDSAIRDRKAVGKATKSDQYKVDETGTLFYCAPNTMIWQKIITADEERQKILVSCHSTPLGSHSGINATTEKITRQFYWKGVKEDVREFVSKCYYCQTKNRGSSKKKRTEEGADSGEIENEEDEEFSQEATKALIEGIRKRYDQLSEKHTRPVVYKEVQEELAQKGFYFNKERVRRKWNALISMHKKMRREFFELNPTWEYYQMIDSFHGDTDYGLQEDKGTINHSGEVDCHNPKEEETSFTCTKQNSSHSGSVYSPPLHQSSFMPKNEYVSPQVTTCPSAQTSTSDFHPGPPFVTLHSSCVLKGKDYVSNAQGHVASHQSASVLPKSKMSKTGNTKTDSQREVGSSIKTVPMVFKIVPDLTGVHGVDASQVPPITVVGALSGKNEVKQISEPKLILNKSPTFQTINSKYFPSDDMKRQERLKLKTLLSINKELKNLSKIQENILKTQEQILNAVKSNTPSEETSDINKRQEILRPLKRSRKK
ncbi:uncharacterized protein [Palaemon carinicauda]|uniref:uncharacterized protein isoform X2 n=1 Tax=Palaemon carinicauda TaxID=392227 RepID=UPI0035B5B8BA